MNLKDTYNRIANDWHKDHQNDDWSMEAVKKFAVLLKPGNKILDIGCGPGLKSEVLAGRGLKVVGIDISEKMIKIAKQKVPDGKFIVLDMRNIDQLKENYEGIFAQASLLHIPKNEVVAVLKKITSKLKNDGYFYIAVKEKKEVDEEVRFEEDYGYKYERFFSYFTLDEIKSYLMKLNMKIVFETITHSGKANWIQVIGKK